MTIVRRAGATNSHVLALGGQSITTNAGIISVGQSAAPAWATGLTLNDWTTLPVVNTHSDVQAANSGQYGDAGPDSVLDAWSGSVHVPSYGTHGGIFHRGGGHKNYYGNEMYVFDLGLLKWFRLTSPSVQGNWAGPFPNGILPDGRPNAGIHTYYYLFERNGKVGSAKRQVTNSPTSAYMVTLFDPVTNTDACSITESALLALNNDEGCCYDSRRDVLWVVETAPLQWSKYSFATDLWTDYPQPSGSAQPKCGPIFLRQIVGGDAVLAFVTGNLIWGLDPANPSDDKVVILTTGSAPTFGVADMPRWSSNLGKILYYPSTSNSIYALAPPATNWRSGAWPWSQLPITGSTGPHTGQGTYGKFQVIEWGNTTVAMNVGSPSQAYRACKLAA